MSSTTAEGEGGWGACASAMTRRRVAGQARGPLSLRAIRHDPEIPQAAAPAGRGRSRSSTGVGGGEAAAVRRSVGYSTPCSACIMFASMLSQEGNEERALRSNSQSMSTGFLEEAGLF